MFAFILESLGATELLFILAVALIFFGPRKLPQLARTMGKGLAEFRKASDDFKQTWEREVALETVAADTTYSSPPELPHIEPANAEVENGDVTEDAKDANVIASPQLEPVNPEWAVARGSSPYETSETTEASSSESSSEAVPVPAETNQPEPLRKHDWL